MLIIIGGASRSGKSLIAKGLLSAIGEQKEDVAHYSTDRVREGIRYLFTEEKFTGIQKISITADVEYVNIRAEAPRPLLKKETSINVDQDELTWRTIKGIIYAHDRRGESVVVEGVILTPERISELELDRLTIKVAFVGFSDSNQINSIIDYSMGLSFPHDWIKQNLLDTGGDRTFLEKWAKEQSELFSTWKKTYADRYEFFDMKERSFDEHVAHAVKRLSDSFGE